MEDLVVFAIAMVTLGQVAFCIPQLLSRASDHHSYIPLALFFVANGIIAVGPAVFSLLPSSETLYIAAIFPAWLLLAPALWLYVEGLTSDSPWRIEPKHSVHLLPFGVGLVLTGLIISLPLEIRQGIFFGDVDIDSGIALVVVLGLFLSMIIWAGQSGYYMLLILVRLSHYRKQLKDLFASNEQRELGWLTWVLLVTAGTWLFAFASLFSTLVSEHPLFGYRFGYLLLLILVWSLAHWGLRQKPGFEGRYQNPDIETDIETNIETEIETDSTPPTDKDKKYQRSALGDEQAHRIADKITAAMEQEQLHLDPGLSLQTLAQHLAISPNYISQTLNDTMGTTFFDFVNKWRIESAKPKIIANEDTVLNIAMDVGFNARSSFYKVFKKETGNTPTEFRKLHSR